MPAQAKLQILPAQAADMPALCELLGLLFAQESEFSPDPEAQLRGLSRIMGNASVGTVLVCKRDGCTVGMVNLLFTVSTALGHEVALLEDLVVAPAYRGGHIGTLLLTHAIACARQRGCKRITLLTDVDNAAAHRFYARQGFVRSSMVPLRLALN